MKDPGPMQRLATNYRVPIKRRSFTRKSGFRKGPDPLTLAWLELGITPKQAAEYQRLLRESTGVTHHG